MILFTFRLRRFCGSGDALAQKKLEKVCDLRATRLVESLVPDCAFFPHKKFELAPLLASFNHHCLRRCESFRTMAKKICDVLQ